MTPRRVVIETRFSELPDSPWTLIGVWRPDSESEWAELRRLLEGRNALERIELLPCAGLRTVLDAMVEFGHGTEVRLSFVESVH